LVEILVAVGIGTLLVIAAATIIAPALNIGTDAGRTQVGSGLAKELMDNVRSWAASDWHNINNLATTSANHYYLNTSSSPFTSVSGDESVAVSTTTYTRYFYVENVQRNAGDEIVESGGSYDPSTKKMTVFYGWQGSSGQSFVTYITRSRNAVFHQTDWSGGPGFDVPSSSTVIKFSTSTGGVIYTATGSILINF